MCARVQYKRLIVAQSGVWTTSVEVHIYKLVVVAALKCYLHFLSLKLLILCFSLSTPVKIKQPLFAHISTKETDPHPTLFVVSSLINSWNRQPSLGVRLETHKLFISPRKSGGGSSSSDEKAKRGPSQSQSGNIFLNIHIRISSKGWALHMARVIDAQVKYDRITRVWFFFLGEKINHGYQVYFSDGFQFFFAACIVVYPISSKSRHIHVKISLGNKSVQEQQFTKARNTMPFAVKMAKSGPRFICCNCRHKHSAGGGGGVRDSFYLQ